MTRRESNYLTMAAMITAYLLLLLLVLMPAATDIELLLGF